MTSSATASLELLRRLPKVDRLLANDLFQPLALAHGRAELLLAVRAQLAHLRLEGASGRLREAQLVPEAIAESVAGRLTRRSQLYYRPVLNATGVVLHTGLGRAPLPPEAVEAVAATAGGAQRLELDLPTGRRGGRDGGCAELLCELTGSEAATVVNNNAAATLLVLAALARGKPVLLSRGEMVEIGGSYRVPEILEESGARLVEVGTTNRTHRKDYARALEREPGLVLKVHTSNYRVRGFTAEVEIEELAELAAEAGVPLVHDLGSGCLVPLEALANEPLVARSVAAGADVVCFSGDKMLGGPQAGILVGKAEAIERCRRHPLFRAMRPGRLIYTALEATLQLYRRGTGEVVERVPALGRLAGATEALEPRAKRLAEQLANLPAQIRAVPSQAQAGSGSLPDEEMPSWALRLVPRVGSARELARRLRVGRPAVVGRVRDDALWLDLRTIAEEELEPLAEAVRAAFA